MHRGVHETGGQVTHPSTALLPPKVGTSPLEPLLGPVLNASGCNAAVLAPDSNAARVLAKYSSREGAARSVVTESLPLE